MLGSPRTFWLWQELKLPRGEMLAEWSPKAADGGIYGSESAWLCARRGRCVTACCVKLGGQCIHLTNAFFKWRHGIGALHLHSGSHLVNSGIIF